MSEFQVELGALLQKHIAEFVDDTLDVPVVADFVVAVAVEDMADGDKGGTYVTGPKGAARYRTLGLLHQALHTVEYHPVSDDDE
jgi:hypothetical protein